MKEFVVTIDCLGNLRQVNIQANSVDAAILIAKEKHPDCKILDCEEYIKS